MKENFSKVYGYNKDFFQRQFLIRCDCGAEFLSFILFYHEKEETDKDKKYYISYYGNNLLFRLRKKSTEFSLTQEELKNFIQILENIKDTKEQIIETNSSYSFSSYLKITNEEELNMCVIQLFYNLKYLKKDNPLWEILISNKDMPLIIDELKNMANAEWELE